MLVNEYHRAEALAREKDDTQLDELLESSGRLRDWSSWIGLAALLSMTLGQYALARIVVGYAESGIDRLFLLVSCGALLVSVVLSDRGRRKRDLAELAITLKRKAKTDAAKRVSSDESKQG
jgi:hypothetical protein